MRAATDRDEYLVPSRKPAVVRKSPCGDRGRHRAVNNVRRSDALGSASIANPVVRSFPRARSRGRV